MMPYHVYQLSQAERTKTAAEIRRADEQLGELSRALSSAWQYATRLKAVLPGLLGAFAVTWSAIARLAGENGPVRRLHRTQHVAPHRAAYLTQYRPCFPSGRPSAASDRPGQGCA